MTRATPHQQALRAVSGQQLGLRQRQEFVAVCAISRYLPFTATNSVFFLVLRDKPRFFQVYAKNRVFSTLSTINRDILNYIPRLTSYIIQNTAVYRGKCFKTTLFVAEIWKIAVYRGEREKSRFVAVNDKNRDIALPLFCT